MEELNNVELKTTETEMNDEYRDCDTEVHEPSLGDTLKKVVLVGATAIVAVYLYNKAKPHFQKWKRERCAKYVEKYDREHPAPEEVACEEECEEEVVD